MAAKTTSNVHSAMNLRAACKYADAGYRVLMVWPLDSKRQCTCSAGKACAAPGKHPIAARWQKTATVDKNKIREWFAQRQDAHVGVMAPRGCYILDVDPRNGGKKPEGVSGTPTQHSGGGGLHYVFKGETPRGKVAGWDIKAHGKGYIVAWPSAHISGGAYRWANGRAPWEVEPHEPPESVMEKFNSEVQDDDLIGVVDTRKKVADLDTVVSALGVLDSDAYSDWVNVGQALRHEFGDAGLDAWLEWSKKSDKYPGDKTAERKWKTFDLNKDSESGAGGKVRIGTVLYMARKAGWKRSTAREDFAAELWSRRVGKEVWSQPAPPIDWVVRPCMAAGKVCVLSAAGGSSKSMLAMLIAAHFTHNREFGPFGSVRAGKAMLLLSEEDVDDIHRRMRTMLDKYEFDENKIDARMACVSVLGENWSLGKVTGNGVEVEETERLEYLIEQCVAENVRLLVLDPLAFFSGAAENDNAQMAHQMALINKLSSRSGAAVLVLHHMNKTPVTVNEITHSAVRGASAIVDQARAVMVMMRIPRKEASMYGLEENEASMYTLLRFTKNNYGPLSKDVVFRSGNHGVLEVADEVKHSGLSQKKLNMKTEVDMVRELSEKGLTNREISEKTGLTLATVRRRKADISNEDANELVG